MSEIFLKSLLEAYHEKGRSAIDRMIEDDPGSFIKIIASLMPKQMSDEDDNVFVPPVLVIKAWEPGDE